MHLGQVDLLLDLARGHVAADPGLAGLDRALANLKLLLGQPQDLFFDVAQRLVLGDDASAAGFEVDRVVLGENALGLSGLGVVLDPHGEDCAAVGQRLLIRGSLVQLDVVAEQRPPQTGTGRGTARALGDGCLVEGVHIGIGETGGLECLLSATAGSDRVEQHNNFVALRGHR